MLKRVGRLLLADCGAKCYNRPPYFQKLDCGTSPEIRVRNPEAVCNDLHPDGFINANGFNCAGYS